MDLARGVFVLAEHMRVAESAYRDEVTAIQRNLGIAAEYSDTPNVELYSVLIQVLVALTIDAATAAYGVAKFGGDKFEKHFRWESPTKRLAKAFGLCGLGDGEAILTIVERHWRARNRIVLSLTRFRGRPTRSKFGAEVAHEIQGNSRTA